MYDCRHLEALLRRLDGLSRATSRVLPVTSVFKTEMADSELESGPVFMFASIPSSRKGLHRGKCWSYVAISWMLSRCVIEDDCDGFYWWCRKGSRFRSAEGSNKGLMSFCSWQFGRILVLNLLRHFAFRYIYSCKVVIAMVTRSSARGKQRGIDLGECFAQSVHFSGISAPTSLTE